MNDSIRDKVTDRLEMAKHALHEARKNTSFAIGNAEGEHPQYDDVLESLYILHNWINELIAEVEGVMLQAKEASA